uniref:Reverse transcriptase domain-containing protein n=1 Tax=Lactuca sativa TaxID=4236 RepID=A0A9R1XGY7_LACSA|nr:hypothetical protein LSAT_V11C400179530 [Lactuca sativa]
MYNEVVCGREIIKTKKNETNESYFLSTTRYIYALGQHIQRAVEEACDQHFYHGINLPNNGPMLSQFIYADDVTVIGEWYEMDLINLNRILRCFYIASGLKFNLHNSNIFGVGVEDLELERLISSQQDY